MNCNVIRDESCEPDPKNSFLSRLRNSPVVKKISGAVLALALSTACAAAGKAAGGVVVAPGGSPAAAVPVGSPPPPPAGPPAGSPPPPPAPPAYIPPPGSGDLFHSAAPEEQFCEWEGGRGTNVVRVQIDKNRRRILIVITAGSVFYLDGGVPPGWNLDTKSADPTTGPSRVFHMVTERNLARGTFTVMGYAPDRARGTVVGQFDCVKPGGKGGVVDRHSLTATVVSVGGTPGGSGTPDPFFFRGNLPRSGDSESDDESRAPTPVFAEGALALARPIKGAPTSNLALDLDVGVEPVSGEGWAERAQLGLRGRVHRNSEHIETADGGTGDVTGSTFCGFVRGAWVPRVTQYVRGLLGLGAGVCHAQRLETGPDTDISAATGVAATVDVGIQVGTPNFGGKAGWELTAGGHDAFQTHSGFLGAYGRFNTP